jgi:ankyrin repeat protein
MLNIFEVIDKNDRDEVELFLKQNPSIIKSANPNGITPLLYCLYTAKSELAQLIYSQGENFIIHECIGMGDLEKIKELISNDITIVNSFSQDGWTPLHLAAFWGNKEIVLLLLESGAILDMPSKSKASFGNSPLQAAIAMQQIEIVELLLSKGANPNFTQEPGSLSPLHIAASRNDERVIAILLKYGADKTRKNSDGKLPADIAKERGNEKNFFLLSI